MSASRIDPPAFHYGDGIRVWAEWVVTSPACGCRVHVGKLWPALKAVACIVEECGEEGHAALANDFKRRWADRVPRFPSDWPQMPAVEVDVTWQESERWYYGRQGVERAVGA